MQTSDNSMNSGASCDTGKNEASLDTSKSEIFGEVAINKRTLTNLEQRVELLVDAANSLFDEAALYGVHKIDTQTHVLSKKLDSHTVAQSESGFTHTLDAFCESLLNAWTGLEDFPAASQGSKDEIKSLVKVATLFTICFKADAMEKALELFTPEALGVLLGSQGPIGIEGLQARWQDLSRLRVVSSMIPPLRFARSWMQNIKGMPSLHKRLGKLYQAALKECLLETAGVHSGRPKDVEYRDERIVNAFDQNMVVDPGVKDAMLQSHSDSEAEASELYHSFVQMSSDEDCVQPSGKPRFSVKQKAKVIGYVKSQVKKAKKHNLKKIEVSMSQIDVMHTKAPLILAALRDSPGKWDGYRLEKETTGLKQWVLKMG